MSCPIKVNSKTIELTLQPSCYCVLDLLCVTLEKLVTFFPSYPPSFVPLSSFAMWGAAVLVEWLSPGQLVTVIQVKFFKHIWMRVNLFSVHSASSFILQQLFETLPMKIFGFPISKHFAQRNFVMHLSMQQSKLRPELDCNEDLITKHLISEDSCRYHQA